VDFSVAPDTERHSRNRTQAKAVPRRWKDVEPCAGEQNAFLKRQSYADYAAL